MHFMKGSARSRSHHFCMYVMFCCCCWWRRCNLFLIGCNSLFICLFVYSSVCGKNCSAYQIVFIRSYYYFIITRFHCARKKTRAATFRFPFISSGYKLYLPVKCELVDALSHNIFISMHKHMRICDGISALFNFKEAMNYFIAWYESYNSFGR